MGPTWGRSHLIAGVVAICIGRELTCAEGLMWCVRREAWRRYGDWLIKLKFKGTGVGLVAGAAGVVSDGRGVTLDCATFGKLGFRVCKLKEDIKLVRCLGREEFASGQRIIVT